MDRIAAEHRSRGERPPSHRVIADCQATVNREYAFLKHLYNVAIRDGKT